MYKWTNWGTISSSKQWVMVVQIRATAKWNSVFRSGNWGIALSCFCALVLLKTFCVYLGVCWIINGFLMTTAVLDIRTTLKTLIFFWWLLWTIHLTLADWSRASIWVEKPNSCSLASVIYSSINQYFLYKITACNVKRVPLYDKPPLEVHNMEVFTFL